MRSKDVETLMKLDTVRLRKLREDRGWSQEQLANAAGISVRTVQRAESDGSASRETKVCLAAALGVPHADLEAQAAGSVPATVVWSPQAISEHVHKVLGGTFLLLGLGFSGISLLLPESPSAFTYLGGFFAIVGMVDLFLAGAARRSARVDDRSVA